MWVALRDIRHIDEVIKVREKGNGGWATKRDNFAAEGGFKMIELGLDYRKRHWGIVPNTQGL